jgi:tetratricopeptide (TPR) repeat protein
MKLRFLAPAVGLVMILTSLLAIAGCRSAHTTSAILYIEEQQYQKAVNVLHEGLEYSPDEPDAYFWLGEAHTKLAEEAVRDDDYPTAKRNYELARGYYAKAAELKPEEFAEKSSEALKFSFDQRHNDARREYQQGYYEQAEGFFRLASAACPDSTAAIKNLARMKMQMAREQPQEKDAQLEEALELLDLALEENPDAYALLADKASVLRDLGRADEADLIYNDLVKEHGDDPALLIDVANLAIDQERYERAADLFIQISDLYAGDTDPTNDEDIRELQVRAAAFLSHPSIGRFEDALELYDRALQRETFPTQQTLSDYMQTYLSYGEHLETQVEQEADPASQQALKDKARGAFLRGVEVGNALVGNYPDDKLGYYFLFRLHQKLGDMKAAEASLQKFSELEKLGGTE